MNRKTPVGNRGKFTRKIIMNNLRETVKLIAMAKEIETLKISTKLYLAAMILLGGIALHFDSILEFYLKLNRIS